MGSLSVSHAAPFARALAAGSGGPAAKFGSGHLRNGVTLASSHNWGGYVDHPASAGKTTEIFAEWTVPTVSCPSTLSGSTYHLAWVGMDGWSTNTVEQAGTQDYCSGASATPTYHAWWEFYPYNAIQSMGTVAAGDLVQAYVLYNPSVCYGSTHCGVYTLDFGDLTSGYNFTVVGNPSTCGTSIFTGTTACEAGNDTSAECISEAEGFSSGYGMISNYGSMLFSNCVATIGGLMKGVGGFSPLLKITTYGSVSGKVVQSISGLTNGYWTKSVFTVTWKGYS